MYCSFYQGIPLERLIQETKHSLEFSRTRLNQWAIDLLEGGLNIFGALSTESTTSDENYTWSEEEFLLRVEDHHNIQVICIYKVLKTFFVMLSGNYEDAQVLSDETEPLIYTVGNQGLLPWPEHVFARLLIITALYSTAAEGQQIKWHDELDLMLNRLRIWADNGPENFGHKYLLAAAEYARIDNRPFEAIHLYDRAIEAAQAGNFLQWEGIANERAYSFWLKYGNVYLAHGYWQQAYVCYHRWGTVSKIVLMEEVYRTNLAKNLPGFEGTGTVADKQEMEIKNNLIERQIKQLRSYALQTQQTRLRIEAETQAGELAHATQRLRAEIAERKRAEEEINLKNKELSKINSEKDKFFSIIAHDLRGPFNGFLGLTEIMADVSSHLSTEEFQKMAVSLQKSASTLFRLLENLLNWARSQQGLLPFNPRVIQLLPIVDESIAIIQEQAKIKKIEIGRSVPDDLTVFTDSNMLQTIIRNLVSNAVKFTPKGGKVTLSAKLVVDNFVEIANKDTGIGMSQEIVEQLFRLDVQTNRRGTEGEPSTGLGLLLCKEFVEKHGGKNWVESEEGVGSTFYFKLSY